MKLREDFTKAYDREPTISEIARAMPKTTESYVRTCLTHMQEGKYVSLDQTTKYGTPAYDDHGLLEGAVAVVETEGEEGSDERPLLRKQLRRLIKRHLDPELANIVMLRHGFHEVSSVPGGYGGPLGFSKISKLVGMKVDKAQREYHKALDVLRAGVEKETKHALSIQVPFL